MTGSTAVLLLAEIRPGARLWGWSRYVLGSLALLGVPGLVFSRQLGSGHEGGFGLRPSASRQGLFCVFDDEAAARRFAAGPVVAGYRSRAADFALLLLRPTRCRGHWGGHALAVAPAAGDDAPPAGRPVAALTRASIRPSRAWAFWRHAPPSQQSLEQSPGCRLAVGLGEAPVLRQATFSVWDDEAAMEAYSRTGAHGAAVRAAAAGGFFSEAMFARFVPLAMQGHWKGRALG